MENTNVLLLVIFNKELNWIEYIYYKIKWKYRYLTLFFPPNTTCLLEKQKYQFLQSLVWHIISYWKMILCLFLVAKARVPSVILSSWSAVLSGQIDVPYVYKPLTIMNFRECLNKCFVGRIWEFLVYEVVGLKEFDLCTIENNYQYKDNYIIVTNNILCKLLIT